MWQDIIGHDTVKRVLSNALLRGKVAHAYLFTGPGGLGKEKVAKTFAQAFFCVEGEDKPCNCCDSCKKVITGNHPDLHVTDGKAASIKIEEIREIQKLCQYKPYEGAGKVFIIKNAENMTTEAANCLLKVLEEPTKNTVFLLTAENPYALLPTVLSRCQRLNFQPVSAAAISKWLVGQGVDEARARVVSALSDGIPAKALEMISAGEPGPGKDIANRVSKLIQGDILTVLRMAEEMNNKDTVRDELDLLALWYRDLLVWGTTREEGLLINIDLTEEIRKQAANIDTEKLKRDLTSIMETRKNLRTNVNLRLSLETLLLKLMKSA